MTPNYHKPALLLDALYCSEENWEHETSPDQRSLSFRQLEEQEQDREDTSGPVLLEHDLFWDEEELVSMLSKQLLNQLCRIIEIHPNLAGARREAADWILKVVAFYSFSALTALLAVNYLDRFLVCFHEQRNKPWMTQLAAVACLSIAAKVEETQVPLLLDLQVEDSKYVFEAKTIQRMEVLVLSTLHWKMNPVTPLSFLDYIGRRLALKGRVCWEFLKRCERILLCTISDFRFMYFLPSVMATATMLHVVNGVEPSLRTEYQNQLHGILGIDEDDVEDCCKLITEVVPKWQSIQEKGTNKRKFGAIPGSPNGVIDASFSSDSSNDSREVAASEPLAKKSRGGQEDQQQLLRQRLNHPDFLAIPR